VAVFPEEGKRGKLLIYLEGCFVPNHSVARVYVVPDVPSMLFSHLFTTGLPHPILFPRMDSAVAHISHVNSLLEGEFSAHSCDSRHLSCLKVTRRLGENRTNFRSNVGATQPIGIFLPQRSCKSTDL